MKITWNEYNEIKEMLLFVTQAALYGTEGGWTGEFCWAEDTDRYHIGYGYFDHNKEKVYVNSVVRDVYYEYDVSALCSRMLDVLGV